VVDLVNKLELEQADGLTGRTTEQLLKLDLLVLDKFGYLPFSKNGGALLFPLN
jgi:DNA replication protein DnaC